MALPPENGVPPAFLEWHPLHIEYPDYSPPDDFMTWVSGYQARVQRAFGFKPDEIDKIRTEVVRSLPGKLAVGSALDAYNRLNDGDKMVYDRLVAKLSEEFIDPRAKRKFNASEKYNIRKKNQSIKDFADQIKKDMSRYSYSPATVYTATGDSIPNPEREKEGVRRFIEGIRDERGHEDPEFKRHLGYHLQDESELTWENALEVASRFESLDDDAAANHVIQIKSSEEDEEDTDEEELGAMATKTKSKSKHRDTLSTITDLVYQNQARIANLEYAQERIAAGQEAFTATLVELSTKLDFLLAGNNHQEQPGNGDYNQ